MKHMNAAAKYGPTYLRDIHVAARYDVSRATVWRWVRDGRIPAPVYLHDHCTRWRLDELVEFEEQRAARRNGEAA